VLTERERLLMRWTPSVYAEHLRYVRPATGGQVRPWTFNGYEYLREIHDTLAERAVVMSAAQTGKTETLVNRELHVQQVHGLDTMHLFPAATEATDFSAGRFQFTVEISPRIVGLHGMVDNKGHRVTADGANAYFRGMQSRTGVKSVPVNLLCVDEYDAGDPEVIEMARDRLLGQPEGLRWELDVSTPGLPGRGIDHAYLRGDQRRWHVPCPRCGGWTTLDWLVGVGDDEHLNVSRDDVRGASIGARCCDGRIWQDERVAVLAAGRWVATNPHGLYPSWHISGLVAPRQSWASILDAHDRAQADPDPLVMRAFYNGKLGLPFAERGFSLSVALLRQHQLRAGERRGPRLAPLIAAGVDAGVRGHYLTILALHDDLKRHVVLHTERSPDTAQIAVRLAEYGAGAVVIDAQPNTEASRRLQRELWDKGVRAWLCYYSENMKGRVKWDVDAPDGPQVVAQRTELLNATVGRLGTGAIVYAQDLDVEAMEHCAALQRVTEPAADGNLRTFWSSNGPDHYGHSLAYANLALEQADASGDTDDWSQHGYETEA
jgi:hypothetical protein